MRSSGGEGGDAVLPERADGARKRGALETYVRHEAALLRTAQRFSLCADDADEALQRALEILLVKAPTEDPRELIRWTQTVVKHEALAVRAERERILSGPAAVTPEPGREDWVALLAADADGPSELAERREAIARSREALQALKPQELRALSLLAEGYSYREIGEITGFSHTKINRSLAEGRERFRRLLSASADGSRCEEMRPLLSAFCDGEAGVEEVATLREHLRACGTCRATLRAYRAAPGAAAALAPALPAGRSLLERAHDALADLTTRFGTGPASDSALSQVAASGGTRGVGVAALAKVLAICVGTAGGAAACVASGVVVPPPLELGRDQARAPALERTIDPVIDRWNSGSGVEYEPAPMPEPAQPAPDPKPREPDPVAIAEPVPDTAPAAASGAVEYAPPTTPEPAPETAAEGSSGGGDAAGEFGP